MNTAQICLSCMAGYVSGGVCSRCGKPAGAESEGRPQEALPAGQLLAGGRYRLGRVLGKGGYGITYLAWDQKRNQRVAIKELYPQSEAARDRKTGYLVPAKGKEGNFAHLKMRFSQEAQVLYALQREPEIIQVYHLFEEYGTAFYAMEYLEGEDLGRFMKRNEKLSWNQLEPIVRTVLCSLQTLHEKGLFHRDISPNNIFLLAGGGVRLIDFGSVRSYAGSSRFTTILNARYAPHELWDEKGNQGPWSDLFSLSVTMYQALTGTLPPKAQERIAGRALHGRDPATPLTELRPDAPEFVQRAIEKGMSLDIPSRWQSAMAFRQALFPGQTDVNAGNLHRNAVNAAGSKQRGAVLVCVKGIFSGRNYPLAMGQPVSLGRRDSAEIRYPDQVRTVSRNQCTFMADNKGRIWVRDDGSSNGTMADGRRLTPGQWYPVRQGQTVWFAAEAYQVHGTER